MDKLIGIHTSVYLTEAQVKDIKKAFDILKIRVELGDSITPLEKFAILALNKSGKL